MPPRSLLHPLLTCTLLALGCGGGMSPTPTPPTPTPPMMLTGSTLSLQSLNWNPTHTPVGQVAAVADLPEQVAIFSDTGLTVFSGGELVGADGTVKQWVGAAAVPALGLGGTWLVGLNSMGHVYRLQNQTTPLDVTALYALSDQKVREVAALGNGLVAFALDKGLAVTDGQTLTQYDLQMQGLVGGGGRLAALATGGIQVFDPQAGTSTLLPLQQAVAAAFDPGGKLVAATAQALYQESGQALTKVLDTSTEPVHGLATAGTGVWVALGDHLGLWRGTQIARGPGGKAALGSAALAPDARLWGSVTGDLWVDSGGQLGRVGESSGGGADQELWQQTILPIFVQSCNACHLPGGSSGIDLSSYASWTAKRALIKQRVVDQKPTPMPPAGAAPLTAAQIMAIAAWTERM